MQKSKSSKINQIRVIIFIIVCIVSTSISAVIKLPNVIGNGMVLQRDKSVPIWGWSEKGEKITVKFSGQEKSAIASKDGKWMVKLDPLSATADVQEMVISSPSETITIKNILVGEVWICSGQSNMDWPLRLTNNAEEDIPMADYPNIRLFVVPRVNSVKPMSDVDAGWEECRPENAKNFSAVGYYFGKHLHKKLNVPIGLIKSSWGGTRIEPWTPPVGFRKNPKLKEISDTVASWDPTSEIGKKSYADSLAKIKEWLPLAEKALKQGTPIPQQPILPGPGSSNRKPTKLYNGMIHPMVPYGIRGTIWYQGESNMGEGMLYFEKMKALINGWREIWDQDDLSFYYV